MDRETDCLTTGGEILECVSGRFGWTIAVRLSNRLSDCWWIGCSETDWSIVRVINCKEIDWLIAGREETFAVGAECWSIW